MPHRDLVSPCEVLGRLRQRSSDLYALLLTPSLQAQGLNRAAAEALAQDWALAAYAFADRRCRIAPVQRARDYLLRAEASRRLGDGNGAADDVRLARDLDPLDPLVHQQALRCLDDNESTQAATALVASPQAAPAQLLQAIAHLDGSDARVVAHFVAEAGKLVGWVSWPRGLTPSCLIAQESSADTFVLHPEAGHPLATSLRSAVSISMPLAITGRTEVRLDAGSSIAPWRTVFEPPLPEPGVIPPPVDPSPETTAVLVIVPVFEDVEATVACLDSLRSQRLPHGEIAVVVIDDASPNPRLVAELDDRARRGDFDLIRNARNLGFAASVMCFGVE